MHRLAVQLGHQKPSRPEGPEALILMRRPASASEPKEVAAEDSGTKARPGRVHTRSLSQISTPMLCSSSFIRSSNRQESDWSVGRHAPHR